jgi:hypothetical protein
MNSLVQQYLWMDTYYLETFPKTVLYLIKPFWVGEGSKVKYIIFVYVFLCVCNKT